MISPKGQAFKKDTPGPLVTFRKRAWKLGHKADTLTALSPRRSSCPKLPGSPREIRLGWSHLQSHEWPRVRQDDLASFQKMQTPRFGVNLHFMSAGPALGETLAVSRWLRPGLTEANSVSRDSARQRSRGSEPLILSQRGDKGGFAVTSQKQ